MLVGEGGRWERRCWPGDPHPRSHKDHDHHGDEEEATKDGNILSLSSRRLGVQLVKNGTPQVFVRLKEADETEGEMRREEDRMCT